MIRYIDLGHQLWPDGEEPPDFAFFNTVTSRFVTVGGQQTFDSVADLQEAAAGDSSVDLKRLLSLVPVDPTPPLPEGAYFVGTGGKELWAAVQRANAGEGELRRRTYLPGEDTPAWDTEFREGNPRELPEGVVIDDCTYQVYFLPTETSP